MYGHVVQRNEYQTSKEASSVVKESDQTVSLFWSMNRDRGHVLGKCYHEQLQVVLLAFQIESTVIVPIWYTLYCYIY